MHQYSKEEGRGCASLYQLSSSLQPCPFKTTEVSSTLTKVVLPGTRSLLYNQHPPLLGDKNSGSKAQLCTHVPGSPCFACYFSKAAGYFDGKWLWPQSRDLKSNDVSVLSSCRWPCENWMLSAGVVTIKEAQMSPRTTLQLATRVH